MLMPDLRHPLDRLASAAFAEEGQALTEYALILALIALVTVLALTVLGGEVTRTLSTVARPI